ncbi:hypothetical protein [uncultured Methanomethylovorans sp.]|uniref:hypothetical protein n=1 Tax=uncultured Methanomethylovorans sp. TaxID=183759 RepID=UPI002AA6B517|nr:hypothetical protein [uncultured Methanomethylovorans sp.]
MTEKTESDFHNFEVRLDTTFNKFMEYTSADNVQMLKKYAETLKNFQNRGIKKGQVDR